LALAQGQTFCDSVAFPLHRAMTRAIELERFICD